MAQPPLGLLLDLGTRSTNNSLLRLDYLRASGQILGLSLSLLLIQVSEKENSAAVDALLYKFAAALVSPESGHEGGFCVGFVVDAHDLLDGIGGFACVVEGDGRDEMVEDVSADDVVEEVGVDEAEIAVDGSGGTACEGPCVVSVVRKRGVGVLQEGDCH